MDSRDKHQTEKNHHLIQAMRHAIDGIIQVLREERNMRYHLLAACLAIIMSALLQISAMEWLWILLAIFVVFTSEFLNTVTEAVTDLISAIFAVLVGLIIFIPRILAIIR